MGGGRPGARRTAVLWALGCLLAASAVAVTAVAHSRVHRPGGAYRADARHHLLRHDGPPANAYPWGAVEAAGAVDPYGFPARQCTSYVAWYLNAHGVPFARVTTGPHGTAHFDTAATWDESAREAGFAVSAVPAVGAIAQWDAHEGSPSSCGFRAADDGHVAVVVAVLPDGAVRLAEYNGETRSYAERIDRAPRYLYLGQRPGHR